MFPFVCVNLHFQHFLHHLRKSRQLTKILLFYDVYPFPWWRPGLNPSFRKIPWRREYWLPTPVFLPGEFHEQRSLVGYSPWGCKELDMTERLHFHFQILKSFHIIVNIQLCQISNSGNNPLNYFVECPGDGVAGNFYPCLIYDSPI